MSEVITLDEVYTTLSSSKPVIYKAIVSLILSSGMSTSTLSGLTLYDFLYACEDYFESNEDKTFDNLLKKDPWSIIPCWKLKSEGIITFNTPEATFYLFLYLKEKRLDDLGNLNNPLFKRGDNNFLTSSKISSYVTEFNKLLNTKNYFKSKNLINTFDYICNNHFYLEKEYKQNIMDLFKGKLSNKSKLFRQCLKNTNEIKKEYESVVPYLTARNYNFDKQFLEYYFTLKNKNFNETDLIINYYENNVQEKLQLSYDQSKLLCKFAQDLVDDDLLLINELYLNKLFKKAIVRLIIYNYDFTYLNFDLMDILPEITINERARIFDIIILQLNIGDYFEINDNEIRRVCIDYLVENNLYDNVIMVSKMPDIAERIIFKLIDEEKEITPIKFQYSDDDMIII